MQQRATVELVEETTAKEINLTMPNLKQQGMTFQLTFPWTRINQEIAENIAEAFRRLEG